MKCNKCGAYIDTKTNEGICILCGNIQRQQTKGDIIRNFNNKKLASWLAEIVCGLKGTEIVKTKEQLVEEFEEYFDLETNIQIEI